MSRKGFLVSDSLTTFKHIYGKYFIAIKLLFSLLWMQQI